MQTTTFRISEALRRMKEQSLSIPQFQRPFTWKESQVKLLIDSSARNYPIGSILLLAKSPELALRSRSIDAVIREGYPPDEVLNPQPEVTSEHYYVLDGQQRPTSIARVLLNSHPTKSYYFDLRKLLEEYPADDSSWVVIRARGKNDPDRKERGRLIRSDIALDAKKVEVFVSEYLADSGEIEELATDRHKQWEAAAQIKCVFETIRNYQIPVVILERDAQVESVCRVFETINSTGTRLTTFDLAVARFFPQPDLRRLWNETLEKYPLLVDFDVDGERILQTISLVQAARQSRYAEPTRSDLLAIPSDFIELAWDTAAQALHRTYQWARFQGARENMLPNHGVLVAIASMYAVIDDMMGHKVNISEPVLRRWYFCKILQQGGRQAANYKIGQDFSALQKYLITGHLPEFQPVVLSQQALLQLTRSIDVRYRAMQSLMATTSRHDLLTGSSIDSESQLQDHHLFPKRLSKTHGIPSDRLDTIVNRLPLLAESNRKLSDREPQDYFEELKKSALRTGTMGDLRRRLTDAMIPGNPEDENWAESFSIERLNEFLANRAELILGRIRELIGDSLIVSELSPDQAVDDE